MLQNQYKLQSSQPMSTYEAVASHSEFEFTKILIDKMEKNKSHDKALKRSRDKDKDRDPSAGSDRGKKRRKSSKDAKSSRDSRSKEKKSLSTSKDASQSQHNFSSKFTHAEEPSHTVKDSGMQQDQEFVTGDNDEQPTDRKPLPLIQDHRGCQIIPKDYFINKYLEYLNGGDLTRRYLTSVTKTKAATYKLKWIEDSVPELLSHVQVKYDQHAYLGTSHWGPKRQRFYGLKIMKMYDYGHLEEIEVPRDDQKLYTFKEGAFKRLRLQDIEDMLLLLIQQKLTNLTIDERDGTLDDVRSALSDIAKDKQLYQRRLMRNLEKFVGGRVYANDLRLLERTI
ncbi:hypothetical protein Tco_1130616 [Tanacetum coccineum]